MSNHFVSGGIIQADGYVEDGLPTAVTELSPTQKKAQEEWAAVQADLDAARAKRQEERRRAAEGQEGQSLFEVLQANKAAKQAAFEEANKLQNQFLSLNEDDIGFLDEVREKKRKDEESQKLEIEQGLKGFKEMQKRTVGGGSDDEIETEKREEEAADWTVGRKRRKVARDVMLKKTSAVPEDQKKGADKDKGKQEQAIEVETKPKPKATGKDDTAPVVEKKPPLGLVAYGSDDSDDDDDDE